MSSDAPNASKPVSDARSSDILTARAQIDAARERQQKLVASGKLPPQLSASRPVNESSSPLHSIPGYTLIRELHRGGQGVVYLAVQQSTERQVAIKLLNRAMPFGSGSAGLARFEREIEILSRLKHPNIVTVHDCGRDHGHVFLVMDYVNGRPLDAWVQRDPAQLGSTLGVFAKICDGVNAAHLRGVIHRDLKPSNILVDERGEPHVVDFGLAKLAEESDYASSEFARTMTITGQFIGSLPWASPEQAEGRTEVGALDIRTDVYSLGVILYQLLTGKFPYPVSGRMSDIVRHIVESEPAKPSALDSNIDRELETIVLKCLAKEPERRYQSAGELARDIHRYLAGEAIEARRDSLAYLMAKRLARYRAAAIAAAVMLCVVAAALVVSISFGRHAAHQGALARESADRADREAAQARAVSDFMREVLTSVEPENQGADVRLIDVLATASADALRRFADHPQQEAQVRELLGQVYNKLTLWADAKSEFARASALWRQCAGPDDPRTLACESSYSTMLLNLEEISAAEQVLNELVPKLERLFGTNDVRTLSVQPSVAFVHLYRRRVDEAERLLQALRQNPALANDEAMHVRILAGLVNVTLHRWSMMESRDQAQLLADGELLARERVERAARHYGSESTTTLHAEEQLATFLSAQGHYSEAIEVCRRVLDQPLSKLGECHQLRTSAMTTLAEALHHLGDDSQAAELHLQRLACVRQRFANSPPLLLGSMFDALRFLDHGKRMAEGEALAREVAAALRQLGGGHDDMWLASEMYVAHFVSSQNRLDEAEPMFRELLTKEEFMGERVQGRLHMFYGSHLARRGRFNESEQALQTAADRVGGIRHGTWDSHADDIILACIDLYRAWNKPEKVKEFEAMRQEMSHVPLHR